MPMVSSSMEAAAANGSPWSAGGAVVSPQYCAPYPVELAIQRKVKVFAITERFVVTDVNGNLLFKVESEPFSLHDKRIISDAAGNVILTLRRKLWNFHSTWQVFRGQSSDPSALIFTAKRSSVMQFKTKLNVYLSYNTGEGFCDFKVKGSYSERSCVVYAGESNSTIVAQMQKKLTAGSFFLGKDKFMVTVHPNIDYAFIVALIVILDAINSSNNSSGNGHIPHHGANGHIHHHHAAAASSLPS